MLHKLIERLHRGVAGSRVESYYGGLLGHDGLGTPTMDEARKDYRAMILSQTRFLVS